MEHPRHRHPRCGAGDRRTVSDDPAPELRRRRRRGIALLGAGLAAALYGARAGLDVAIVERRSGVLDKACGDGMMPYTWTGSVSLRTGDRCEARLHRR